MGIFEDLFGGNGIPKYKGRDCIESYLFYAAHSSCQFLIDNNQPNRRNASYEVLLFNSQHILQILRFKIPSRYNEIEKKYFNELFSYSRQHGYDKLIAGSLVDFINNRFELYYNEMRYLNENKGAIPSHMIYNFYVNPLQFNSGEEHDMLQMLRIRTALKPLLEVLDKGVEMFIE